MHNRRIHDHPGHRLAVRLLLRRVNAVGFHVHRETVDPALHRKIFELTKVVRIVFLKYRDCSARNLLK